MTGMKSGVSVPTHSRRQSYRMDQVTNPDTINLNRQAYLVKLIQSSFNCAPLFRTILSIKKKQELSLHGSLTSGVKFMKRDQVSSLTSGSVWVISQSDVISRAQGTKSSLLLSWVTIIYILLEALSDRDVGPFDPWGWRFNILWEKTRIKLIMINYYGHCWV